MISINGHQVQLPTGKLLTFVNEYIPLVDIPYLKKRKGNTGNSRKSDDAHVQVFQETPDWPEPPAPELNQLYWPTGATRWAKMYVLVTDQIVRQDLKTEIDESKMVSVKLWHGSNVSDFYTFEMYPLQPRRLNVDIDDMDDKGIQLLPLVCQRYWWSQWDSALTMQPGDTWSELIDDIKAAMHLNLPAAEQPDLVYTEPHADFLLPDPYELENRSPGNLAVLLDAVAGSIGCRCVYFPNNLIELMTPTGSDQEMDDRLGKLPQIAGHNITTQAASFGRYKLIFRHRAGFHATEEYATKTKDYSEVRGGQNPSDHTGMIYSTLWDEMDDAVTARGSAQADTDVFQENLATKLAEFNARWHERWHDETYQGWVQPFINGYDDCMIYTWSASASDFDAAEEDDVFSRHSTPQMTTRVIALPNHFLQPNFSQWDRFVDDPGIDATLWDTTANFIAFKPANRQSQQGWGLFDVEQHWGGQGHPDPASAGLTVLDFDGGGSASGSGTARWDDVAKSFRAIAASSGGGGGFLLCTLDADLYSDNAAQPYVSAEVAVAGVFADGFTVGDKVWAHNWTKNQGQGGGINPAAIIAMPRNHDVLYDDGTNNETRPAVQIVDIVCSTPPGATGPCCDDNGQGGGNQGGGGASAGSSSTLYSVTIDTSAWKEDPDNSSNYIYEIESATHLQGNTPGVQLWDSDNKETTNDYDITRSTNGKITLTVTVSPDNRAALTIEVYDRG